MTLEVILWAIPVASLAAACGVIAFRVGRLRGDGVGETALLAEAMRFAARRPIPEPEAATVIEFPVEALQRPAPALPPAAAIPFPESRLRPVAIVICRTVKSEAALAG